MKKILIIILTAILLFCIFVPLGFYFWSNNFFFPKKIIPEIEKQILIQTGRKIFIKSMRLNRQGNIIIADTKFFNKENTAAFAGFSFCVIDPDYRTIFKSWQKTPQDLTIPLKILIDDFRIEQAPVKMNGKIISEIILNVNPKSPEKLGYQGQVKLAECVIKNIPILGSIEKINGIINIKDDLIKSENISGYVNNAKASLNFQLHNFKDPELNLSGELNPLIFSLECSKKNNDLFIKQIQASYNEIKLIGKGKIKNFSNKPLINAQSSLEINLADLAYLPLEMQNLFKSMHPQGSIKTNLDIHGPLLELKTLRAKLDIVSDKITIYGYDFNDLVLNSSLNNSILDIPDCSFNFRDNIIKFNANVDLCSDKLPFTANLNLKNLEIKNILNLVKTTPLISGRLASQLSVKGYIQDLTDIQILGQCSLTKSTYEKFILPPKIEVELTAHLLNFKDLLIEKLRFNDALSALSITGKIENIIRPDLKIKAALQTSLHKLSEYPSISLPSNLKLAGDVSFNLNLDCPLSDIQKCNIPFKLNADSISLNQIDFQEIKLQGNFQQMGLTLSDFSCNTLGSKFTANAFFNFKTPQTPSFELESSLTSLNLNMLKEFIPSNLKIQGILGSQITVNGKGLSPDNLQANIKLKTNIENAAFNDLKLDHIFLTLNTDLKNNILSIDDLNLNYNDFALNVKGIINSIFNIASMKNAAVKTNLDLNSTLKLNLSDLSKLSLPPLAVLNDLNLSGIINLQTNITGPIPASSEPAEEIDRFDWKKINNESKLVADKLSCKGIVIQDLNIHSDLKDKKLNLILNAKTYEGTVKSKIETDFSQENFMYTLKTQIDNVNIGNLIEESKIIPQTHKGILSINSEITGTGFSPEALNGEAQLKLDQARLSGLEILHSFGSLIGVDYLSNFEVTQASGLIKIQRANLFTQDFLISGPDADISLSGTIGFDQHIDLVTTVTLTESAAAQTHTEILDKFFILKNKLYYTFADLTGTLTAPQVSIESLLQEKTKSKVSEIIADKGEELLKKLFH